MKVKAFLILALCAVFHSCDMVDAQIVWLSNKNMDFSDCEMEDRNVRDFEAITCSCPFDVIYEQSRSCYVTVEGDEAYLRRVYTRVNRGVLDISLEPMRYRNVRLRVRVGSPDISELVMTGSGSIICSGDIETGNDLTLRVTGSGDITARNIECADLTSSVAGSGDIKLGSIAANQAKVSLAGSGDWTARRIVAENLEVSVAGSGDVSISDVDIENELSVSVAGSGDVRISGSTRNAVARVIGSGDITGNLSFRHISKSKTGSGSIRW